MREFLSQPMSERERRLIYPALIFLIIWATLQQVELYIQRQALESFKVSIQLQTEILDLDGKRLSLLEELLMMQTLSPFSEE